MEWAILLSGEHETLPQAELRALLAVHAPDATVTVDRLVGRVEGAGAEAALVRMALAHAWGEMWAQVPDDDDAVQRLADVVRKRWSGRGEGPVAVVGERRAGGSRRSPQIVQAMGAAAAKAGARIDLRDPRERLFAWFTGDTVTVGLLGGMLDRSRYEARTSETRGHFAPVSMHPRRAASLLHLAQVPQGGTVYDPFCGTGGFVLEAVLEGYRVLASDRDPWMVQGTYQTLTDVPAEPMDADVFIADIAETPDLVGPVDAIVTDLPYGRASGTDREPVAELYLRSLQAFGRLLKPGGRAVIGCADPSLLVLPEGLVEVERHAEFVHRSLTRHYVIVKRTQPVDGT